MLAKHRASLAAAGVSDHHIEALAALPASVQKAVNWQQILAILAADGPKIITDIVAIFTPATK